MKGPVLRVQDLAVTFESVSGSLFHRQERQVRAVDGINFELFAGETLGVVGESGSGKSTLARAILGLIKPNRGRVMWMGENLTKLDEEAMRQHRKELQIVFQDPVASLDPRMTAGDIIAEPLWTFYPNMDRVQVDERTRGMMKMVGLLPNQINRYPHEFSGGQCQRIGIARSLVVNPRLIICDEPVSALDVSIQAQIINLLQDLQTMLGLALIFIAHDLSVVRHISDRVLVMYLGTACEIAPSDRLFEAPAHPYTRGLIASAPDAPEHDAAHGDLAGEPPSPLEPPGGCGFHPRCPVATERCRVERPRPRTLADGHEVACHHPLSIGAQAPPVPVTVGPRG